MLVSYDFVMSYLPADCLHLRDVLSATWVTIEIAIVGAIVAFLQLRYAQNRDKKLDERTNWEKVHKAMIEFRVRRELFNNPFGGMDEVPLALEAFLALNQLRAQLNRVDSPLATEIENYLQDNWQADKWRASEFIPTFDEFTRKAAEKSR